MSIIPRRDSTLSKNGEHMSINNAANYIQFIGCYDWIMNGLKFTAYLETPRATTLSCFHFNSSVFVAKCLRQYQTLIWSSHALSLAAFRRTHCIATSSVDSYSYSMLVCHDFESSLLAWVRNDSAWWNAGMTLSNLHFHILSSVQVSVTFVNDFYLF